MKTKKTSGAGKKNHAARAKKPVSKLSETLKESSPREYGAAPYLLAW
ncbi:MAG: hypothetical protein PHC61_10480 [Chitinivibrionales bacterium]|nr:hypothetical protein [Chitinivibrionales bacterium]